MSRNSIEPVREVIDAVYQSESRRILATLIRLLGDFDLAEDALHDAFAAALERWPRDGVPANPRAWLVSTGRFKAIDVLRRRARFDASQTSGTGHEQSQIALPELPDDEEVQDDRLRLIFTCCHPALAPEARVALTLREVCGLTTEAIARAFLTTPSTLAQRIVRAKSRIREARIPYQVPSPLELPDRVDAALQVIAGRIRTHKFDMAIKLTGGGLIRPRVCGLGLRAVDFEPRQTTKGMGWAEAPNTKRPYEIHLPGI